MQSPYFVRYQRHPDVTFLRPFGCAMIVHRGRDLVEHSKLAPRGEKCCCFNCIYLGVGTTHGRRAFIGYSARLNRVYATVDAKLIKRISRCEPLISASMDVIIKRMSILIN